MIAEAIKTGLGIPERSYRGAIFVSALKGLPLIGPRLDVTQAHGAHPREPFWVAARNEPKRTVASRSVTWLRWSSSQGSHYSFFSVHYT